MVLLIWVYYKGQFLCFFRGQFLWVIKKVAWLSHFLLYCIFKTTYMVVIMIVNRFC